MTSTTNSIHQDPFRKVIPASLSIAWLLSMLLQGIAQHTTWLMNCCNGGRYWSVLAVPWRPKYEREIVVRITSKSGVFEVFLKSESSLNNKCQWTETKRKDRIKIVNYNKQRVEARIKNIRNSSTAQTQAVTDHAQTSSLKTKHTWTLAYVTWHTLRELNSSHCWRWKSLYSLIVAWTEVKLTNAYPRLHLFLKNWCHS